MDYRYVPTVEGMKGFVKLKLMNYKDRLAVAQSLNLKSDDKGESEIDELGTFEKTLSLLKERTLEISLKFEEHQFSSIEDLEYFAEGTEVINELMKVLLGGPRLGKKSKERSGSKSESATK